MARAGARVHNPAGHAGLIDNAIGLISALFAYVETRAALLAVESKAMLLQLAAVIAFALGALIAVVFGYVFVLASLIAGIAHSTGVGIQCRSAYWGSPRGWCSFRAFFAFS